MVTITEASWVEAQDAGEAFVSQGAPEDPALKLVGGIEGEDEDRAPVYLRAGKAKRGLTPSKDGEFLDIEEGSTATAISEGCNADVFLKSIDKKKQKIGTTTVGGHKNGVDEDLHDEGISAVLVGLKFVAGAIVVKREGLDNVRPTLIAEEIVKGPKAAGGGKKKDEDDEDERPARRSSRAKKDEDDDEDDDEKPVRGKKRAAKDEDDEDDDIPFEAEAEKVIVEVLENPKFKKGLPVDKAWQMVFNLVRKGDPKEKVAILKLVEDNDWLKGDRPWKVSGKGDDAVLLTA